MDALNDRLLRKIFPSEYGAWNNARLRCRGSANKKPHKDYGQRGITLCERWNKFETFLADIGPKPTPKHSLDRINNDLGYSPENCRWATKSEQCFNRRLPMSRKERWVRILKKAEEMNKAETERLVAFQKQSEPGDGGDESRSIQYV